MCRLSLLLLFAAAVSAGAASAEPLHKSQALASVHPAYSHAIEDVAIA